MKKFFVANWKMNLNQKQTLELFDQYKEVFDKGSIEDFEIIVAPSNLYLSRVDGIASDSNVKVSAQNCSEVSVLGAYTGQTSANQLSDLQSLEYCIIGHSEPRYLFDESDEQIAKKFVNLLSQNIKPILCISENSSQRDRGETEEVISGQISTVLSYAKDQGVETQDFVVAYEPAWAISTFGSSRTVETRDVVPVVEVIKQLVGIEVPILYGGSVRRDNASIFMDIDGISGLIVGGASLDASHMFDISSS